MKLNPKNIFLVDALGALLSASMAGLVLPLLQEWVGLPTKFLQALGLLALLYFFYSSWCYRFADHSKAIWLRIVIVANLLYPLITAFLIALEWEAVTHWGLLFFASETLVVVALVSIEWQIMRGLPSIAKS